MISAFPYVPWRGVVAFGGLLSFFVLENLRPFKPAVDPRVPRWTRNVFISVFNSAAMEALFGGVLVAWTAWLESRRIGLLHNMALPSWAEASIAFLYLDFTVWFFHWLYHNFKPMWRLHQVHHSDLDLDVTSASRFHIGEIVLSTLYRLAVITAIGPSFQAVLVFEACLLLFAQMEHSNFKIPDAWDARIRWLFVTPDMHRVHHSDVRNHTNSNFSTIFSFWDRVFRTYRCEGIDQRAIRIGIPEFTKPEEVRLWKLMLMPGKACSPEL